MMIQTVCALLSDYVYSRNGPDGQGQDLGLNFSALVPSASASGSAIGPGIVRAPDLLRRGLSWAVIASIFSFWAATANSASAQAFNPIHTLTNWYTDRNLVDLEIVGSTSMLPEFHKLEPKKCK